MAWLSPILWPFLRVLAVFTTAPMFSMRVIPMRGALGAVAQQVVVGLAIGFAVRLVFVSVELAGEVIGLQMGLNFASFFDPTSNAQVSAVARFFGNMGVLLFVVINGHLVVLMAVLKSFESFPADGNFLQALAQMRLYELGTSLFSRAP